MKRLLQVFLVFGILIVGTAISVLVVAMGADDLEQSPPPPSVTGIDPILFDAYIQAAATTSRLAPECVGMRWQILAGIGQVESNQAAGHTINLDGGVTPLIIGPPLDGSGVGGNLSPLFDTDGGQWDRDTEYDRAVGVLQFLPSTWKTAGRDGNGDGVNDPHNVFDAAHAAVAYLCGDQPVDLTVGQVLRGAIHAYNQSTAYVDEVMWHIDRFDRGETGHGDDGAPVADMNTILPRAQAFADASAAGQPDPFYGATSYHRMCAQLAARIHGHAHSGFISARTQWNRYVAQGIANPGKDPPPGALIFWDTFPFGHVAVYLGDGMVATNDIYDNQTGRHGGVYIAPIDDFHNGPWRLPYLGWAPPAYGAALTGLLKLHAPRRNTQPRAKKAPCLQGAR